MALVVWEQLVPKWSSHQRNEMAIMRIGDVPVITLPNGKIYRASDGIILLEEGLNVVGKDDGLFLNYQDLILSKFAIRRIAANGDRLIATVVNDWNGTGKLGLPANKALNLICDQGKLYAGGGLVFDLNSGKQISEGRWGEVAFVGSPLVAAGSRLYGLIWADFRPKDQKETTPGGTVAVHDMQTYQPLGRMRLSLAPLDDAKRHKIWRNGEVRDWRHFGAAAPFPYRNRLYVRSYDELICIGASNQDLAASNDLKASSDQEQLRRALTTGNQYLRLAALETLCKNPSLTTALAAELVTCVTSDSNPAVRGRALDAVVAADANAPVLKTIVTGLNADKGRFGHDFELLTLSQASDATSKALIPLIRPDIVQKNALEALVPMMRRAAQADPQRFTDTIAPVFPQLDHLGRRPYAAMFGLGGATGTAALPVLRTVADQNTGAVWAIRQIDTATFDELAPAWARAINDDFTRRSTQQYHALRDLAPSIERLRLLGKHQALALPGLQTFAESAVQGEQTRKEVAEMIAQIKAGTFK